MDHVEVHHRVEDGRRLATLVWRPPQPWRVVATSLVGGGIGERGWLLNAQVPLDYGRLDGEDHLAELAAAHDLRGPGVGMLTGVDVARVVHTADGGAEVLATVGLGSPTWAAAPDGDPLRRWRPGTVNLLVLLPVPMADAALVNAVVTATEAKVQALGELGVPGTGTASDAVCVACPAGDRHAVEPFGGPRSTWGARLARAVHAAVLDGAGAGGWAAR